MAPVAPGSLEKLLRKLEDEGGWPSPDVLAAILAKGDEAVEPLRQLVRRGCVDPEVTNAADVAAALLGQLKARSSVPDLLRLLREGDMDSVEWTIDALIAIGEVPLAVLEEIIRDDNLDSGNRAMAVHVYEGLAEKQHDARVSLGTLLTDLLADLIRQAASHTMAESAMTGTIISVLSHLAVDDARPVIDEAFKIGIVEEWVISPEDVEENYKRGGRPQIRPAVSFLEEYRERYAEGESDDEDGDDDEAGPAEGQPHGWQDEDDDEVVAQTITSAKVGRNDPCPCGSGKKFKKCCLAKASAHTPTAYDLQRGVHDQLVLDLRKFVNSTIGAEGVAKAWDEFWPDHPSHDFRDHAPYHPLFLPWLHYLYVPEALDDPDNLPSPHTLAAQFLRKRRHTQSELAVKCIEAALREPLVFWQIEDIEPGKGLHLKDMCTGRTVFAYDVAATKSMRKFDIVFAQVIHVDGIYTLSATAPYAIPPARYRTRITDELARYAEKRSSDPTAWLELDMELLALHHTIVEELFHPPKPKLSNTSGDPMLWTTTRYSFDAPQRQVIMERVRHVPDVGAREEDPQCNQFIWRGAATDTPMLGRVTKANITVGEADIVVRANSMVRDREFRGLLERELGTLVRHESTSHETIDLDSADGKGPGPARLDVSSLPAEAQEQLRDHIQQLYMKWADEKVPALGGLTPRDAVKTPEGRAKVIGLVNDWEHTLGRDPKPQVQFDFGKLRRDLGIVEE